MGDRIAVLNHGVLQQVDDPSTIYSKPTNMFVATILGSPPMNFFKCKVEADGGNLRLVHTGFTLTADSAEIADRVRSTGDGIVLGVRPEDIHIHQSAPSGRTIPAEIYVTEPLGNETIVDVKVGENVIKVLAESDFDGNAGDSIHVSVDAEKLHLFDSETHECMYHTDSANPLVLG
jgi:multiple sugar transport system ATP-binding protein